MTDTTTHPVTIPPAPPTEHILQFFRLDRHLPHEQPVVQPFRDLAYLIVAEGEMPAGTPIEFPLPRNPERTVALRKLLEAKDAAVRALIAK